MHYFQKSAQGAFSLIRRVSAVAILLGVLGAFATSLPGLAHAAPAPANAVIGNQAAASYVDSTGKTRTATSNLVQTTVQQVYAHELSAENVKIAAPETMVHFAHTLSNTGNGVDSFALSMSQLSDDNFNLDNLNIYADGNGDGVPDNELPISSTGPLAAGQTFRFVVSGSVGKSQVDGAKALIRVGAVGHRSDPNNYEAGSTSPSGNQKGNTDTATVSKGAVLTLQKSYSKVSGPASNTLIVTLHYVNYGLKPASGLVITDTIGDSGSVQGVPFDTRQMSYVPNSTRVNGMAVNDNSRGVSFSNNRLTISLPDLQPTRQGSVRFSVKVNDATAGAEQTTNVAGVSWSGGVQQASNAVSYKVKISEVASVALGDSRAAGAGGGSEASTKNNRSGVGAGSISDVSTPSNPADSAALDNGIVLDKVPQGGAPVFHSILTNTGEVADSFNLKLENVSYPTGTRFELIDAAGVPLTDSNGDGIADSGPLSAKTAMDVFVRATLPVDALAPAAGWTANLKAASTNDNAVSDQTSIKAIGEPRFTVDVRNTSVSGPGGGFASGDALAAASLINAGNPGQSVAFKLWITNSGSADDNYELQSFGAYAVNTEGADSTGDLPAGWTVRFVSTGNSAGGASCSAAGASVRTTGVLPAGGGCEFDAVVTLPMGYEPSTKSLFFRAWSSASAVDAAGSSGYDVIRNDVTVNSQAVITLTPNGSSPVGSGGVAVFAHQLCNAGNVSVTAAGTLIVSTHSDAGFSNTLLVDANGNGQKDSDDQAYVAATNGVLEKASAAGPTCINLLNSVKAPSGAGAGLSNTTTLVASAMAGTASVTATASDKVTINLSPLALSKKQKIVDCDTGAGGDFVGNDLATPVAPGNCLRYRIEAYNTSGGELTDLKIVDSTPNYTTLKVSRGCQVAKDGTSGVLGGISKDGETGTLSLTVPSLADNSSRSLEFCVKVDQ
jgi:hypothetical protein